MTPKEFKDIRMRARLSFDELEDVIGVSSRNIRRYEKGTIPISKPVQILMRLVDREVLW